MLVLDREANKSKESEPGNIQEAGWQEWAEVHGEVDQQAFPASFRQGNSLLLWSPHGRPALCLLELIGMFVNV